MVLNNVYFSINLQNHKVDWWRGRES